MLRSAEGEDAEEGKGWNVRAGEVSPERTRHQEEAQQWREHGAQKA